MDREREVGLEGGRLVIGQKKGGGARSWEVREVRGVEGRRMEIALDWDLRRGIY